MTLLLNLYLGHLLGDFVLQPGWLVAAKRRNVWGLLTHVGIIGVCTAIILHEDISSLWNIVLLAMAAHVAIEVITIRARASTKLSGLSVFLIDQALHVLSIVVLVWTASPYVEVDEVAFLGMDVSAAIVAFLCALVATTFMGAVIIFEVVNSMGPESWNRDILPYDRARILGMIERASALAIGVFVNPALIFVPFLPRMARAFSRSDDERAQQMIAAATGLVVCVMGWAVVAGVAIASQSMS
ncbi:MAG: DUF3307 domain-containing protein [Coriobacteriia bacterium]|nr:DUF3307 domain-containing protein [Coriobacteriia bacterium]